MKLAFEPKALYPFLFGILLSTTLFGQTTLVTTTDTWSYRDINTRPAGWPSSYSVSGWSSGPAPLGYSNGVTTTVSFGADPNNKYITTYFHKSVNIADASAFGSYTMNLVRDDGAIIYVNGQEVVRSNMPKTAPAHNTLASTNVADGAPEAAIHTFILNNSYFVDGANIISVEVHQSGITSTDLSFSLELIGTASGPNETFLNYGENWKYLDNGTNQNTAWRASAFADAGWFNGNADFGYSNGGGEFTQIDAGCTPTSTCGPKHITTYFRKSIYIEDPTDYSSINLNYLRDDGIAVFINGTERHLDNLTTNPAFNTLATSASDNGTVVQTASLSTSFFVAGINVIAVEVHQTNNTSTDLMFDMEILGVVAPPPPATLIAYGSAWNYKDLGTNEGTAWRTAVLDGTWKSGNSKFGYGDPVGGGTVVFSGCGTSNYPAAENPSPGACAGKYITTYFRKNFTVTGLNNYTSVTFNVIRDDGYVIYINGTEVARGNMPAGPIAYNTLASGAIGGTDETTATTVTVSVCNANLVEGLNVIAVEIHQNDNASTDLGFNLEMIGNSSVAGTPTLTRQPYLQMGGQSTITIRWRTSTACNGRVELGSSFGTYTLTSVDEACSTTEHSVTVSGLTPDTKYFYRISTTDGQILQAMNSNFFTTVPTTAVTRKLRFGVFGDCGRNDNSFQSGSLTQYQRYLSDNGVDAADAMILLGDNAYSSGSEAEYISGFFTPFGSSILRNHKVYPSPGNHDYTNGSQPAERDLAYYRNFTMPTNGELGGVPSFTEAFYSYDIGDVHFLSLDSYGTEAGGTKLYDTTGPQVTWVKADLAATNKKWVIAYWHHPPYTKGSHDSDTENDLRDIRENFIRILERNGVDMIMCGHSHDYERSYLLKGYYKANPGDPAVLGPNFNVNTHAVTNSNGRYNGTANSCVYTTTSGKNHHGTVYVLSGSSGADGGVVSGGGDPWPHNALPNSIDEGGMFVFEVEGNRLDAKFISRSPGAGGAPVIQDQFTILKDVNQSQSYSIPNGTQITLTASWPGTYTWTPGAASTRAITVTPPSNATTVYTVADAFGCIADQFTVTASGALPVNLTAFDARLNVNRVDLTWATATEINNNFFTIERSLNGIDFTNIGTTAAAGNTTSARSYSFTDNTPVFGVSYYRLSQTDFDGNIKYLGTKRIVYNATKPFDLKVVGTSTTSLSVQITSAENGIYALRIYDMLGRERWSEKLNVPSGNTIKQVMLAGGAYIVEIMNDQGETMRQKVVLK